MARAFLGVILLGLFSQCWTQSADLNLKVSEEVRNGFYIGNVSDIKDMFKNMTAQDRQSLVFGIINKNTHPGNLFRIESNSGKLLVERRLDREVLCDYTDACLVEFDVAVHSTATVFSDIATVSVEVEDINDNAPSFPNRDVTLDVPELASIGTILKISGAVDKDSVAPNTIQQYVLSDLNDLFTLDTVKNLDGSSVINLRLEKQLDREVTSEHQFQIVAVDGGSPPKSGTLDVSINVLDENDNPPRFLNSSYSATVKEDEPINTTIIVVSAVDPDLGNNGRIRYQFSNLQSSRLQSLFSIDADTGAIRVAGKLEYEPDILHQLIVEAQDSGASPLKTQTVVTVTVEDSGNNKPVVSISALTPGNIVSENAGVGFFVAYVEVEDSDPGESGNVVCSISSSVFALQPLSGKKGYKVLVNGKLDREKRKRYNMTIVCKDKGTPPMTGSASLDITVTDVNDETPKFQHEKYDVSIRENSALGSPVLTVTATDDDEGRNARIKYYVVEQDPRQSFKIQRDKGVITTNRRFDRETEPVVRFVVHAVDEGINPLTGTTEVTLNILDVNDNFPVFTRQIFQFRVQENQNASIIVGNITATDADAGANGEIEYFIAESPDGIIPFKVLPNGTVIANDSLDRETQKRYIFTVLARDKGSPPKTNSSEISITVLDENDNAPSILFPTTDNHTVFISRAPEQDSVIGKIVAYDGDRGENSSLTFSISAGNVDDAFAIDSKNGETKVADISKLKNDKVYKLVITVQDSGSPPLKTDTHLIIDVEFDNVTQTESPVPPRNDKYVVIAAVVAAATVVLSIIIIAAICFVLRTDPHKSASASATPPKYNSNLATIKTPATQQPECVHLPSYDDIDGGKAPPVSGQYGTPMKPPRQCDPSGKKKGVSFSIEDGPDTKPRDLLFSNSKLALLDNKDKILHLDDVHSDTSGETIPSDSGRGGSEEEVNIPERKTYLNGWDAPMQGNKSHSFDQCFPVSGRPSTNYQIPNNQTRFLHMNSFQGREMPRKMGPLDGSRDFQFRHGQNNYMDYSKPPSYRRQSSNMSHDDDGSTTTSGSYTVNHDDFGDILGKDVIV